MQNTSDRDKAQLRIEGNAMLSRLSWLSGPEQGDLWDELHNGRASTLGVVRCMMKMEKLIQDTELRQLCLW